MRTKQKYTLSVREQDVTITFSKINDSRKIPDYRTDKKPNLFHVRGAMECTLVVPSELAPSWWKSEGKPAHLTGYSFCTWMDKWKSQTGRHFALRHAMRDLKDKEARLEIWAAFEAEEKARTKEKGPARIPKTAKPKVRKPRAPVPGSICEILGRIAESLELLASPNAPYMPKVFGAPPHIEIPESYSARVGTAGTPGENAL